MERDPESLILFMLARFEREKEENASAAGVEQLRAENHLLRQRLAKYEQESDSEEEDSE